jgi:hypothetical protein
MSTDAEDQAAEDDDAKFYWHSDALNKIPHGELIALCQTLGMNTNGKVPHELTQFLLTRPSSSEKEFLSEALLELLPGYKPGSAGEPSAPTGAEVQKTLVDPPASNIAPDFGSDLKKGFLKSTQKKKKSHPGMHRGQANRLKRGEHPDAKAEYEAATTAEKQNIVNIYHPEASEDHHDLEEGEYYSSLASEGAKDIKRQRTDSGQSEEEVIITPEMEKKLQQERSRSGKQHRYCQYPRGCTRFPYYGEPWDRVPRFCLQHRHDHHLDVRHPPTRLYNSCFLNGTRISDWRNIKVVEDENDPKDNERLRKAFAFLSECDKCGANGAFADVYYEFPILVRRMNTRRYVKEVWKETTGQSEPESDPSWVYNTSWETIPIGPHYPDGTEEWKRYEANRDEDDLRTNKEVEDAEMLR